MEFKKEVGARIKATRLMRNLTQEQLAEKVQMSPQSLSQLERGENFVSADILEKISKTLEVSPCVFFDFECGKITGNEKEVVNFIAKDIYNMITENPDKAFILHKITKAIVYD